MVFLPRQSTNVATARLFPYLCPEGQFNAVATDPFSFTDNRSHTNHSSAAADGGRLPFSRLVKKHRAEFKDHRKWTVELLKLLISSSFSLEVEVTFF